MNAFLRILGWTYIFAIVLINIFMAVEVYNAALPPMDPWKALFDEYGICSFVFWVELFAMLLPGIILLAIRDIRIKLKEKAELDAKEESEDDFAYLSEEEVQEKLTENHQKNGCACTKCTCQH